jgi:hypothetical protein
VILGYRARATIGWWLLVISAAEHVLCNCHLRTE